MAFLRTSHPLILASGSSIRRELLERLGLDFTVRTDGAFDEEALKPRLAGQPFPLQAAALARGKAEAVSRLAPEAVVIAADQICEHDGEACSKPGSHDRAVEQLLRLAGGDHRQHVAVCLYRNGALLWEHAETATLTMRPLSRATADAYLRADEAYFSAGAYKLEGRGKALFTAIDGDHDVILGLPVLPLIEALVRLEVVRLG